MAWYTTHCEVKGCERAKMISGIPTPMGHLWLMPRYHGARMDLCRVHALQLLKKTIKRLEAQRG